jgi:hypothetical protein
MPSNEVIINVACTNAMGKNPTHSAAQRPGRQLLFSSHSVTWWSYWCVLFLNYANYSRHAWLGSPNCEVKTSKVPASLCRNTTEEPPLALSLALVQKIWPHLKGKSFFLGRPKIIIPTRPLASSVNTSRAQLIFPSKPNFFG